MDARRTKTPKLDDQALKEFDRLAAIFEHIGDIYKKGMKKERDALLELVVDEAVPIAAAFRRRLMERSKKPLYVHSRGQIRQILKNRSPRRLQRRQMNGISNLGGEEVGAVAGIGAEEVGAVVAVPAEEVGAIATVPAEEVGAVAAILSEELEFASMIRGEEVEVELGWSYFQEDFTFWDDNWF
jgi:hypothetical protein